MSLFPALVDDTDNESPQLIASECRDCGRIVFPPAGVCPTCMRQNVERRLLAGVGKLYTYTILYIAAPGRPNPSILGYVDLPEDVRVFAHINAPSESLVVDMPMQLVRSKLPSSKESIGFPEYVFEPIIGDQYA